MNGRIVFLHDIDVCYPDLIVNYNLVSYGMETLDLPLAILSKHKLSTLKRILV